MRRRNKSAKVLCGTPTGCAAHLRRHERPCRRCLPGSSTYTDEEIRELIGEQFDADLDHQLWRSHRLTLGEFKILLEKQRGGCACCSTKTPGKAGWCVDHDPLTGEIRGILCAKCDAGIGQLGDDLDGVRRALTYLRVHEERGGHPRAEVPPAQPVLKISATMRRCFALFKQAVPLEQVVVILRLPPETVEDIHALWSTRAADAAPVDHHVFQVAKDPLRCLCSCGFTITCTDDPDGILRATDTVNAHIKAANSDHKRNWEILRLEEEARRAAEAQQESARRRQRAKDDMQRRSSPLMKTARE